jgi:hypothetical protein
MFFLVMAGCGIIKTGSRTAPNDPVPIGTIVAKGSFTGQNSQEVTGVGVIYRLDTNEHVVRVEGLSAPSENALQIRARRNGSIVMERALRSNSGTQNYVTDITESTGWDFVIIHSSLNNKDYGSAPLTAQ